MSSTQTTAPRAAAPQPQRSWVARHKILTTAGVLLIIVLVGFYFLGWPLVKLRFHPQYSAALELVTKSPEAIEKLGAPIQAARPFPGGSSQDDGKNGSAQIYFAVLGPKSAGDVSINSRMLNGEWGFSTVKLKLADSTEIDLLKGQQGDVPNFDPNAKQATEVTPPDLPLNIDLNIPGMPQDATKKN